MNHDGMADGAMRGEGNGWTRMEESGREKKKDEDEEREEKEMERERERGED
jgi:hypothetical protein